AILAVTTVGGLLGSLLAPRLGLVLGGLGAMAGRWGLGCRPRPACRAWGAGAHGGQLGAAVPTQPRCQRLAARGGGGAAHRPTARPTGAARVGGPARPGPPGQPGQPRSPGDRPRWSVRHRLQTVPRPPAARPIRAAVAWPPPPRPHPTGGGLRRRPGR